MFDWVKRSIGQVLVAGILFMFWLQCDHQAMPGGATAAAGLWIVGGIIFIAACVHIKNGGY